MARRLHEGSANQWLKIVEIKSVKNLDAINQDTQESVENQGDIAPLFGSKKQRVLKTRHDGE